jgi:hypothetical protein
MNELFSGDPIHLLRTSYFLPLRPASVPGCPVKNIAIPGAGLHWGCTEDARQAYIQCNPGGKVRAKCIPIMQPFNALHCLYSIRLPEFTLLTMKKPGGLYRYLGNIQCIG